jgi:hypothetical protein
MCFRRIVIAIVLAVILALPSITARPAVAGTYGGPLPPNPATGLHRNNDGEPGIAADGGGTFWVGSNVLFNNDPRSTGLLTGEDIWKSVDGGRTYQWVASPFGATSSSTGPAGEDSDITAATVRNAHGYYNVYATSLWVGSTSVAISQDGGKTWTLNPLGGIPAEDRPWIAADGACVFYVAYHQLPTWDPVVNKYDVCNQTDLAMGASITPVSSTRLFLSNSLPALTNDFGKLAVDNSPSSRFQHSVYVPMMGCDLNGPVQIVQQEEQTSGCLNKTQVFVGISRDGGKTFSNSIVAEGTNGEEPIWCCNVTTDRAGTVYFAWSDNHNSYLAASSNGGQTWSKPVQINHGGTAVYPAPAGGTAGVIKVAFYGTTVSGDTNDVTKMGTPNTRGAAPWTVQVATSSNYGRSFVQQAVAPLVHTGVLCTEGDNCSVSNSRNLYDDFGAAISPTTGALSVAYTSDQPGGQNTNVFTGYATLTSFGHTVK